MPFVQSEFPNVAEQHPESKNQKVRFQFQRGLVGLGGESRLSDGNNQFFHTEAQPNPPQVQPLPPPETDQPPPRRPDVPCETQQPPDLAAPVAPAATVGAMSGASGGGPLGGLIPSLPVRKGSRASSARSFDRKALARAGKAFKQYDQQRSKLWTMDELNAKAKVKGK